MSSILFTHPSAELYGADRTLLQVVEAIAQRCGDPNSKGSRAPSKVVVALPRRGVLAERLEELGAIVEVGELGAALRADLSPGRFGSFLHKARRGARFVESLVERHGIDIIHTNTTVLIGAAYGAHRSGAHHVWHVHEILDQPSWARLGMRNLIRRWCDVAVANSRATAAAMLDPKIERAVTVHNGVSADRSARDLRPRPEIRRAFGITAEHQMVVLPGRINAWKGHRLALDAAERLGEDGPRFVFAGSPPPGQEHYALRLDAEIKARGLSDWVSRIPFTDDLPSPLAAADVCIVPSTRPEPFGIVAIEAMAVGTPVVAAAHGGLQEIVDDGATGALFTPRSADDLVAKLTYVLADPERLARMGRAAAERQQALFTHERYAEQMLSIYASLTAPWTASLAA